MLKPEAQQTKLICWIMFPDEESEDKGRLLTGTHLEPKGKMGDAESCIVMK